MRTISPKVDKVLDINNHLGETPVWSAAEGALYWVNCEEPSELIRWDPKSGDLRRWPMPERIGGFVFRKDGGALVALARGLHDFDFASGVLKLRIASPLPEGINLHECMCDRTGRFWVGSINMVTGPDNLHPGGAKFFRLDGDRLTPVIEDISCANGLAFAPDGKRFYFSDSTTQRCQVFDVDPETGAVGNGRTFFTLSAGEGFVDGATCDAEGGYWPAIVYAGGLRRYLPDGTLDHAVKLPFLNPTKPAFGGDDFDTLYVTTLGHGQVVEGMDGGLFAFRPGVRGLADPLFVG